MRVLLVTNGFPPVANAGVESHTYALARELQRAGHTVHVLCRDADLALPMYTVRYGTVDGLDVTRIVNNLLDVHELEQLYRNPRIDSICANTLAHFRPDIVHVQHCIGLSLGCMEQAISAGIPTLVTMHDYWYICPVVNLIRPDSALCAGSHRGMNCLECVRLPDPPPLDGPLSALKPLRRVVPLGFREQATRAMRGRKRRTAVEPQIPPAVAARVESMRAALSRADLITTPSFHLKAKYEDFGIPSERLRVVPLGMDVAQWQSVERPPRPEGAPLRLGFAGTFLPSKGALLAAEAFRKTAGHMTLEFVGFEPPGNPYPAQLKAEIASDPRMSYVGALPNHELANRFANWDALLMPAQWEETFSFVTREALLAGLPVIASDLPVLPEIITHGKNGFLVRPAGDVGAWAAQFRALVEDPSILLGLDPRADGAFARSFTDHAAEQFAIYEALIANKRTDGAPTRSTRGL